VGERCARWVWGGRVSWRRGCGSVQVAVFEPQLGLANLPLGCGICRHVAHHLQGGVTHYIFYFGPCDLVGLVVEIHLQRNHP
jgi:hypothetical protein